ncbi:MAG: class I SAM-dependent methyltransferase [Dongiaceae bacterium]
MAIEQTVAQHYTHGSLEAAILDGLRRSGKDPNRIDPDDLAPADEFHIGGRAATVEFAEQLDLRPGMELLDIGSGIGGPARYFAHHRKCRVTGIDLTDEYVRVAGALSQRAGFTDELKFVQGSALSLPFPPGSFDGAYMLHVGMNIADKATLFGQVKRVLRPGGVFGVYDVMRIGAGDLAFPVPWARTAETSFVADAGDYRRLLGDAGFVVQKERERRAFAIEFFKKIQARVAESGLPPLGLHIAMGADFPHKVKNLVAHLENGLLAPIEMICRAA